MNAGSARLMDLMVGCAMTLLVMECHSFKPQCLQEIDALSPSLVNDLLNGSSMEKNNAYSVIIRSSKKKFIDDLPLFQSILMVLSMSSVATAVPSLVIIPE